MKQTRPIVIVNKRRKGKITGTEIGQAIIETREKYDDEGFQNTIGEIKEIIFYDKIQNKIRK